jgi:hypothetical protein
LYLVASSGGTDTVLASGAVSGLTVAARDVLRLRFALTGDGTSSTLNAKVWKASGTEPASWQRTVTGNTAGPQAAGGLGLWTYLSGSSTSAPVAMSFDNLTATKP